VNKHSGAFPPFDYKAMLGRNTTVESVSGN